MPLTIIERNALPSDLDLENVKNYLRVYDDEHDATILVLVQAAVEFIQTYTRQTFRSTQYSEVFQSQEFILPRFPVITIDSIEETIDDVLTEIDEELLDDYDISDDVPPEVTGDTLELPVKITWTAGYSDWPKDLILLVWQMVEENFDRRGTTPATAQAAQFSRAHQLALEQYCTHHDAVR